MSLLLLRRLRKLRLLSTTTTAAASPQPQAPPPNPNPNPQSFSAEYLIRSCGLSPDEALRAYNKIQHLKSPLKPDAALQFLRRTGIREPHIRTAVSRQPRLLCSGVEKNLRPNVAKLLAVGLSVVDVSGIISRSPSSFLFNFVPKIDFWMQTLGSVENLSLILKRNSRLLESNTEKVVAPNLSFLQDRCGLSIPQIAQLIKMDPRVFAFNLETLKMRAKRAEELGFARSSHMFVYALLVANRLNQQIIDARVNNLKSLGLSQEEVNIMVHKSPLLLGIPEELVRSKMEFLLKEAGCDKVDVVRTPVFLSFSLEKRLIPRNFVRKLLMSKGLPVASKKFASFVTPTEKLFVERFVLPFEHTVPGLHQAYSDASAAKIGGRLNDLKSI